ncbi:MAG: hypothetical protein R3B48_13395 [Kofleriaceae bacterium]
MAALVLSAVAGGARGEVLSEDALEGTSREAGVVLRSYGFALGGAVLRPPVALQDTSPLGLGVNDLRFYFAETREDLKLVIHAPVTATLSSDAVPGNSIGAGVPPPRWLPLRAHLADRATFQAVAEVDWVYLAWLLGPLTLTVGRQPITLGRAAVWRPEDLLAAFSLTEVDTEYKRGVDAVRLDWAVGERRLLHVYASPGELAVDHDAEVSRTGSAALVQFVAGGERGELGALVGWVRGDLVVGVDGTVDGGSFDVHGEATVTRLSDDSLAAPGFSSGDVRGKAVVGMTFHPTSTLTLGPELLYNGFGATKIEDRPELIAAPRVLLGEQVTLGVLYGAASGEWNPSSRWTLGGLALVNTTDQSALLSARIRANLASNAEAELGGYLAIGRAPNSVTKEPVTEYGLYPDFVYLKLKAVL